MVWRRFQIEFCLILDAHLLSECLDFSNAFEKAELSLTLFTLQLIAAYTLRTRHASARASVIDRPQSFTTDVLRSIGVRDQCQLGKLQSVARIFYPLLARKSSGFAKILHDFLPANSYLQKSQRAEPPSPPPPASYAYAGKHVCTWVVCAEPLIGIWKVCNSKRDWQTRLANTITNEICSSFENPLRHHRFQGLPSCTRQPKMAAWQAELGEYVKKTLPQIITYTWCNSIPPEQN